MTKLVSVGAIALLVAAIVIVALRGQKPGKAENPRVAQQEPSSSSPPPSQREESVPSNSDRKSEPISEPSEPVREKETVSRPLGMETLRHDAQTPPPLAPLPPPTAVPSAPSAAPSAGPHPGVPSSVPATPPSDPHTTPPSVEEPPRPQSQEEDDPPQDEAPPAEEGSGSDHTAPVLVSLRFDPPEVPDGSVTNLLIQASDDLSGVTAASGIVSSPSGSSLQRFTAQKTADGPLAAQIAIPKDAESGTWFVFHLDVLDGADNPFVGRFSATTVPAGGTLRVSSSGSDSTPPRVRSAAVQYRSLPGGEKNVISIVVDDDRSGVAEVTGAFQGPSGSATISYTCHATDSDFWEGDVPIPPTAECGLWSLFQIKVVDKADNSAILMNNSPVVAGVAFTVSGGGACDSTPPTLEAFSVSPTVVSSERATQIVATATVSDVGSGTQSMYGWFSGPASTSGEAPRVFFSCTPAPDAPESPWTCIGIVPQHAATGTWRTGLVRLLDKAQNQRDYNLGDPAIAQGNFEVQ